MTGSAAQRSQEMPASDNSDTASITAKNSKFDLSQFNPKAFPD